jgi:hypothetical protein
MDPLAKPMGVCGEWPHGHAMPDQGRMTRKTDGGKGDRIPGTNPSAYEAGYDRVRWNDMQPVPGDTGSPQEVQAEDE